MVVEVLRALGTQIIDVAFQGVSGIDTENIQRQHLWILRVCYHMARSFISHPGHCSYHEMSFILTLTSKL